MVSSKYFAMKIW